MNTLLLFLGMGISWSLEILAFYMLDKNVLVTDILNMFQVTDLAEMRKRVNLQIHCETKTLDFLGGCQEGQNKDRDKCGISFGPDNKRGIARQGF